MCVKFHRRAISLQFDEEGRLPPGEYPLTFDELETSILVLGDEDKDPAWDTKWRVELVQNLRVMVEQLWKENLNEIYIDGSFATDKLRPGDIDGYFVVEKPKDLTAFQFEESLCERLNKHDQHKVWTWKDADRRKPAPAEKGQLPMWHKYHVEMWPEYGQWSGQVHPLTDKKLTHAQLFRITKLGEDKGIIKLLKK